MTMSKTRKKLATEEQDFAAPNDTNAAAPQANGDTTAASLDRQRIAMRAYELYLARGGADGAALDDWLTAEREMSQPR
jgi:Protein of unknown function (DUF2934)